MPRLHVCHSELLLFSHTLLLDGALGGPNFAKRRSGARFVKGLGM